MVFLPEKIDNPQLNPYNWVWVKLNKRHIARKILCPEFHLILGGPGPEGLVRPDGPVTQLLTLQMYVELLCMQRGVTEIWVMWPQ